MRMPFWQGFSRDGGARARERVGAGPRGVGVLGQRDTVADFD